MFGLGCALTDGNRNNMRGEKYLYWIHLSLNGLNLSHWKQNFWFLWINLSALRAINSVSFNGNALGSSIVNLIRPSYFLRVRNTRSIGPNFMPREDQAVTGIIKIRKSPCTCLLRESIPRIESIRLRTPFRREVVLGKWTVQYLKNHQSAFELLSIIPHTEKTVRIFTWPWIWSPPQNINVILRPCILSGCSNHSTLEVVYWPSLLPVRTSLSETLSIVWRNQTLRISQLLYVFCKLQRRGSGMPSVGQLYTRIH